MRKKCLAVLMGVVVLFGSAGVLRASANTLNPTINGISFSAYSRLDDSSASAGTVSGSPYLEVSVSSTYVYYDVNRLHAGLDAYSAKQDSASGKVAATVSFSAPKGCESSSISSSHTASSGSENWSGETEATR